jgi:L-2-hydroxyglutarate oxidase
MDKQFDFVIVGGGIVGVSTAWQLQQAYPNKRIALLEKETQLAQHQTGHNSGVIHAGIYYQPGSLKAKFCKQGLLKTITFCQQKNLPYKQIGKLLVATNGLELERMLALEERAAELGIEVELLDKQQLLAREPNVNGIGALFVKDTGIVDYVALCQSMADEFEQLGGSIIYQSSVTAMHESKDSITLDTNTQSIEASYVICCGGLMADRLAKMLGLGKDFQIVPYRGEYYRLDDPSLTFNHLVYPIPDPELPFLGVHITPMVDGTVTVGPNAVQGWKREGYGCCNFSVQDTAELLRFPGFWKVASKHWMQGVTEFKNSLFKSEYTKLVQKYCDQITPSKLSTYPAGIRAQAVKSDGTLVHDFLFEASRRSLHVCNAPSPAATSAMPIGEYIVQQVTEKYSTL